LGSRRDCLGVRRRARRIGCSIKISLAVSRSKRPEANSARRVRVVSRRTMRDGDDRTERPLPSAPVHGVCRLSSLRPRLPPRLPRRQPLLARARSLRRPPRDAAQSQDHHAAGPGRVFEEGHQDGGPHQGGRAGRGEGRRGQEPDARVRSQAHDQGGGGRQEGGEGGEEAQEGWAIARARAPVLGCRQGGRLRRG